MLGIVSAQQITVPEFNFSKERALAVVAAVVFGHAGASNCVARTPLCVPRGGRRPTSVAVAVMCDKTPPERLPHGKQILGLRTKTIGKEVPQGF